MARINFVSGLKSAAVAAIIMSGVPAVASTTVRDSVLTISAGTEAIAAGEFTDRTDFNRIVFEEPCRLREIGEYAFMGCSNLKELRLPDGIRKIGEGAFRECTSLRSVSWPGGTADMARYTFAWCASLQRAELPATLTDIGSHAFAYCAMLREITLPCKLRHVGSNAFSFCKSLESIDVPATVTELESYAFSECESLRRITLPGNGHLLGELILSGCRALESITELSAVPPQFDCNSTLFEDGETYMYDRCRLLVPATRVNAYRQAPGWDCFKTIGKYEKAVAQR